MGMKFFLIVCLALNLYATSAFGKPATKIACVGTSITYGVAVENREQKSYPAQLQMLLGAKYQVLNFGVNSTTLLRKGDNPYWNSNEYQQALKSNPDMVFIELGTNDTKNSNRVYLDEFEKDYQDLVQSFLQLPSHPQVVLLLPTPIFFKDNSDSLLQTSIIPKIRQIAYSENLQVIDMHSLLLDKEALLPDKLHPNGDAFTITSKRLYDLIVQKKDKAFDIFNKLPGIEKNTSSFYGYACADFTFTDSDCKIVKPKWSAKGHPFVWRARFWGHEPQADIAMLERGFHIVYCDAAELFGNSEAISKWNNFYTLITKAGLTKKAVMEGMSRGGVYVFNWAAANPKKVACVYVDNPVLNLKSWPGGKGKSPGSPGDWEVFKKDYGYTSEEATKSFAGSPIDKTAQIVKGKYPILILCADADEAVPADENTFPFEQKIKALKGNITVMVKHGFKHHPHSLPNPTPIVDFILKATGLNVP